MGWNENYHAVHQWAELLRLVRAHTPGLTPLAPPPANELTARATRIRRHWRETLRYHANVARESELARVREDVSWLLRHAREL